MVKKNKTTTSEPNNKDQPNYQGLIPQPPPPVRVYLGLLEVRLESATYTIRPQPEKL